MTKVLLSLHGFHSSPNSLKAQQMSAFLAANHPDIRFVCPQLPTTPEKMWQLIETIFERYQGQEIAVMGSSLGGYLATKVAQQYGVKVLLINPAVFPYLLLQQYAGLQVHPYTQDEYLINHDFMQQLRDLEVELLPNKDNCWVLLQQGDEVLDYQQALDKYQGCKITCEAGGDHSFVGFDAYLAKIINFLFN